MRLIRIIKFSNVENILWVQAMKVNLVDPETLCDGTKAVNETVVSFRHEAAVAFKKTPVASLINGFGRKSLVGHRVARTDF